MPSTSLVYTGYRVLSFLIKIISTSAAALALAPAATKDVKNASQSVYVSLINKKKSFKLKPS